MKRKSPKEVLAAFPIILKETAKFYGVPETAVNRDQFHFIGNGRAPEAVLRILGGFSKLKEHFAPGKANKHEIEETRKILEKILGAE